MGASGRRRADRALRAPMRSPGRPPVARREHRQRFWEAIAGGSSSEESGVAAGVSPAVGTRWFREGGGMPTVSPARLSGRFLSFVERDEIAVLHAMPASWLTLVSAVVAGAVAYGSVLLASGYLTQEDRRLLGRIIA